MKAPKKQRHNGKKASQTPFLQRMEKNSGSKCEEKSFISKKGKECFQTQLKVNQPGDQYEQEADRMANHIMRESITNEAPPMISRKTACPDPIRRKSKCSYENIHGNNYSCSDSTKQGTPKASEVIVQRNSQANETLTQMKYKNGEGNSFVSNKIAERIEQRKGQGFPLPPDILMEMESGFGEDFSAVRIHTDSEAATMNEELNARAFTHGSDIYFNRGEYQPETDNGKRLLSHELTHVVQQGEGIKREKTIDKQSEKEKSLPKITETNIDEVEEILKKINKTELKYPGAGYIEIYNKDKDEEKKDQEKKLRIVITKLKPKEYLWDADINLENFPAKIPKNESRNTAQKETWEREVKGVIKGYLENNFNVGPKDKDLSLFLLKTSKKVPVLRGSFTKILNEVFVPFWDIEGNPRLYDVEHMVDWQILGSKKKADEPSNLILLDRSYNRSLGSAVRKSIHDHLKLISESYSESKTYSKYFSSLPTKPKEILSQFDVFIRDFDFERVPRALKDEEWYYAEEIIKDRDGNPFKKKYKYINIQKVSIDENHFVLKPSEDRVGYVLPFDADKKNIGAYQVSVSSEKDEENGELQVKSIILTPLLRDSEGNLEEEDGKPIPIEEESKMLVDDQLKKVKDSNVYYITKKSGLRRTIGKILGELVGVKGLSRIKIKENDIELDGFNLSASGTVISSYDILEGDNISFEYENGNYRIEANVPASEIEPQIPKALKINTFKLSILSGSDIPTTVSGHLGLKIPGIGEGQGVISFDKKNGLNIEIKFDFESDIFKDASLTVGYGKDGFSIEGDFKIDSNKLPGLKEAEGKFDYDGKHLIFSGCATLDIPGDKEIKLGLGINENGLTASGDIDLKKFLPKGLIKDGKLNLSLQESEDGYSLSGKSEIEPNIPFIKNSKIEISYIDGAIIVSGVGDFEIKKGNDPFAKGENVKFGLTNRELNDKGDPTGDVSDDWHYYGGGNIELIIRDYIRGSVTANLDPETGHPIVSGTVEAVPQKNGENIKDDPEKLVDKTLFESNFSFPLLTLPIGKISVSIGTSAKIYAYLYLVQLKKMSLSVDDIDLFEPSSLKKLKAEVIFEGEAKAGIVLEASIGLDADLLHIIKASVEINGDVFLDGKLKGELKTELIWTPRDDLIFGEIEADLKGMVQLIARLYGEFKVYLNFFLFTIDLIDVEFEIGEFEGDTIGKFQLKAKGKMENNMPQIGSIDENSLIGVPNLKETDSQATFLKKAAGSQNKEFKDPEPPSPDKAIKEIQILPAGPIDRSYMETMDRGVKAGKINQEVKRLKKGGRIEDAARSLSRGKGMDALGYMIDNALWMTLRQDKVLLSRNTYLEWLSTRFPTLNWMPVYEASLELDRKEVNLAKRYIYPYYELFGPTSDQYTKAVSALKANYPIFYHLYPKEIDPAEVNSGLSSSETPKGYIDAPLLSPEQNAKVKFLKTYFNLDVYIGSRKGILIVTSLETENLKDQLCELVAYFYYWNGKEWTKLQDYNDQYSTLDDQVSVSKEIMSRHQNSIFEKIVLFIPYGELHLGKGDFDLSFKLSVYPKKKNVFGKFLEHSPFYNFSLTDG